MPWPNPDAPSNTLRPRVLVLLAAFNGSSWIAEQIRSILGQIGVDLELVVCDDGSTDTTREEIGQFAHDRRVKITYSESPSGSAAKNFLRLVRTTASEGYGFVALADQDDIWDSQKLIRGCSMLRTENGDGYSCAVSAFWDDGTETVLRQAHSLTRSDFLFEGAGQGCTFVLTANFYLRLRGFLQRHTEQTDNLHFHDWAIYALSRSWGLRWCFDRESLVRYRQHQHNDTGARATIGGIARRFQLIRSGWYANQLRAIADLSFAAAPTNSTITEWRAILDCSRGLARRFRIAGFCMRGGRRRSVDNAILFGAAVMGWI
jgi:rhamnosyltransferase